MNTCDLEETKHLALQKFLELAEKPEEWKRKIKDREEKELPFYYWSNPDFFHTKSKFEIIRDSEFYDVRLGGTNLISVDFSKLPTVRSNYFNNGGKLKSLTEEQIKMFAETDKQDLINYEERMNKPYPKAITNIIEFISNLEKEERRRIQKEKDQVLCLKLLKDLDTNLVDEPLIESKKPWWKIF